MTHGWITRPVAMRMMWWKANVRSVAVVGGCLQATGSWVACSRVGKRETDQQAAARTATAAPSRPGLGCVTTCTAMRSM